MGNVILKINWLVVLKIYVALAIFQLYRNLEAGDNQSLKSLWRTGNRTEKLEPQGALIAHLSTMSTFVIS